MRSRAGVEWPDVQIHFLPVALSYDGTTVAETRTGHPSRCTPATTARPRGVRARQRAGRPARRPRR